MSYISFFIIYQRADIKQFLSSNSTYYRVGCYIKRVTSIENIGKRGENGITNYKMLNNISIKF